MTASLTPLPGKRACVIGAGLGGLALAIRLQAAGVETVLVEAATSRAAAPISGSATASPSMPGRP
jgi:2-polyprenyl-6-methoxyphenol hydroxylase-like FAD-dependent oxidoreductase